MHTNAKIGLYIASALLSAGLAGGCKTESPKRHEAETLVSPKVKTPREAHSRKQESRQEEPKREEPEKRREPEEETKKPPEKQAAPRKGAVNANCLSEEALRNFGRQFVAALREGRADEYVLTSSEVSQLFTPSYANIIKTGPRGWIADLAKDLKGQSIRFQGINKGPNYGASTTTGKSPSYVAEVPHVKRLRVEITSGGNPYTIIIKNMYYMNGHWKILQAEALQ